MQKFRNSEPGQEGGTGPTLEERLAAAEAERDALKAKHTELLGETKKAKEARRIAEQTAAEEARRKAEAEGNHEQLYKSAMAELERTRGELSTVHNKIANEKVNNTAMEIAAQLAEGHNAKLLSEFIAKRLKFAEDGVRVTDSNGNLTVSTLSDLANEFKTNESFASLVKGNQSAGGSARGSNTSGSAAKISRHDFEAMDPRTQSKFIKDGGRVFDPK